MPYILHQKEESESGSKSAGEQILENREIKTDSSNNTVSLTKLQCHRFIVTWDLNSYNAYRVTSVLPQNFLYQWNTYMPRISQQNEIFSEFK